jgi:hypothetical protein
MDWVFDIALGVAVILSNYIWYKLGRDKGYAEGVEKTLKAVEEAIEEAMEREVGTDEKRNIHG